jgi:hypothetical protein
MLVKSNYEIRWWNSEYHDGLFYYIQTSSGTPPNLVSNVTGASSPPHTSMTSVRFCLNLTYICYCYSLVQRLTCFCFFYPEDGGDTFIRNIGNHLMAAWRHNPDDHNRWLVLCHDWGFFPVSFLMFSPVIHVCVWRQSVRAASTVTAPGEHRTASEARRWEEVLGRIYDDNFLYITGKGSVIRVEWSSEYRSFQMCSLLLCGVLVGCLFIGRRVVCFINKANLIANIWFCQTYCHLYTIYSARQGSKRGGGGAPSRSSGSLDEWRRQKTA